MSQRHDLGRARIEHILTSDFSENVVNFELAALESRRKINVVGSGENLSSQRDRKQLSAWNTAYLTLNDDEGADDEVEDVGTGFGQSHRQKLQDLAVPQLRTQQQSSRRQRGPSGVPNAHLRVDHSASGGAGVAPDALKEAREFHASVAKGKPVKFVTRRRVVKQPANSPPALRPTLPTPIVKNFGNGRSRGKQAESAAATESFNRQSIRKLPGVGICSPSEFRAALQRNFASSTKQAIGSSPAPAAAQAVTDPVANPPTTLKAPSPPALQSILDSLPTLKRILQTDRLNEIETVALKGNSLKTSKQEGLFAPRSNPAETATNKVDQSSNRQARETTSIVQVSNGASESIPQHLRQWVTVRGDGVCVCKFPKCMKGFRSTGFWTKHFTLKHETAESAQLPSTTPAVTLAVSNVVTKSVPTSDNGRQSLSQSLARQRDIIIGEHVYKGRFKKISDVSSEQNDVKIAPLADRTNQPTTAADHGAAVRAQYADPAHLAPQKDFVQPQPSASRDSRPMQPLRTGPALPAFLRSLPPTTDTGAAARAQYTGSGTS